MNGATLNTMQTTRTKPTQFFMNWDTAWAMDTTEI